MKELEERCEDIVDEVKDTKTGIKTLRKYIDLCRKIYEEKPKKMPKATLECLQDCLEFLDDDLENSIFFIKVCIAQMEYSMANELVTFYMQSDKLKVEDKSTLRELRVSIREAQRRKEDVNSRENFKNSRLRTMYNY